MGRPLRILAIDGGGRSLPNRVRRVAPADGFFLGPLLGGALRLNFWFQGSTPSAPERRKR